MNKVYIGNITFESTEEELEEFFEQYGEIVSLSLIRDRQSGRSKGFAFVEYETNEMADEAVKDNGQDFQGRNLVISIAHEKKSDSREHAES